MTAVAVPDRLPENPLLEGLERLPREVLGRFDDDAGRPLNRCFYLSKPPAFFGTIVARLGEHALHRHPAAAVRVVIETPFGSSLEEAQRLNRLVTGVLEESQVFRIDHHLGKETVQNLMALRFANHIFESVWNRNHIEHVQITAPESIGPRYPAGSQGPAEAKSILAPSHEWRRL